MKTILLSAVAAFSVCSLFAQDAPPAAPGGMPPLADGARRMMAGGGRMGAMLGGGDQLDMLTRMLQDPIAIKNTLGVSDEQIEKLQQLLAPIDVKIKDIDDTIQKLGLEQANIFAKTLADKEGKSEEELLALTDKIGKSSTDRARLRVQRLLAIKQVLTPDQVDKASSLIKARAARQAEINRAIADGDMETVGRLFREQMGAGGDRPGGDRPGGFRRGGDAPQGGNRPDRPRGNRPDRGNDAAPEVPAPQGWN